MWFNQLTCYHASYFRALLCLRILYSILDNQFPFHSYYGDGSAIEPACSPSAYSSSYMWSCAMGFHWRMFDVAILDNKQVLHGRMGWSGERKLVTALINE